ncbi:hypothetical protein TWF281_008369 [Arthrobotrys megalospora]
MDGWGGEEQREEEEEGEEEEEEEEKIQREPSQDSWFPRPSPENTTRKSIQDDDIAMEAKTEDSAETSTGEKKSRGGNMGGQSMIGGLGG